METVKDETLIGKKLECTKCKFRFVVEAPGKSDGAKKDTPAKPKITGKEAAAKAKQEIKQAESKQKPKSSAKMSDKNKKMLMIGGGVGLVALVAIVAALFLFPKDSPPKDGKVASNRSKSRGPTGPDTKVEEKEENKDIPKVEMPTPVVTKSDNVDPDLSNRLPNDSKFVAIMNIKEFFDSKIAPTLFKPGAFRDLGFKKTFGIPLEDIDQIMLARSAGLGLLPEIKLPGIKKSWKMAIIRSDKPFDKAYLEKSIGLTQEAPIEGISWSKIEGQLDPLSYLLLGFDLGKEKVSFLLADSRTIVLASEEKMNDYLKKDKAKPRKISSPPPPTEVKPAGDPNNPMPGSVPPDNPIAPGGPAPIAPPGTLPNAPADPNAPTPGVPPNATPSVAGNQFQTLPLKFSQPFQAVLREVATSSEIKPNHKSIINIGVDLSELAAVIPLATVFLGTVKTPGGAPIPPDVVSQVKNLSKLEFGFICLERLDKEIQMLNLQVFSQDRKIGADFAKLVFPFINRVPLISKLAKLDISASTEDLSADTTTNPNGTPNNPSISPLGQIPVGTDAGKPSLNGNISGFVKYRPNLSITSMGMEILLKLPDAMTLPFEQMAADSAVSMKNSFETLAMGKNAEPMAKALTSYVNEKKAFPRGTAIEATNNQKFGLKMAPEKRVGWIAELLPYFSDGDYSNFANQVDKTKPWSDAKNLLVARIFVPDLLYASPLVEGQSIGLEPNQFGTTTFIGVSGVGFESAEYPETNKQRGIFAYDRLTKLEDIKDGPANTIALLLTRQNKNQVWLSGGGATIAGVSTGPDALEPFLFLERINRKKEKELYGIAIMADGKVREISTKISPDIFRALCTIEGGEKIVNLDAIAPLVK